MMKRLIAVAVLFGFAVPLYGQQANKPDFTKVEKLVAAELSSFSKTDVISREDVASLLEKLPAAGLKLKNPSDLLRRLLPASDFLYIELNSDNGRKFAQDIASLSNGYDRVDRLCRIPRGQQTVHDLVQGPGGAKMIEYMTSSSGGKELGNQLANCPGGGNFNTPTNRIYTVPQLLTYLKAQFDAQQNAKK
jgi:hypothetical protein